MSETGRVRPMGDEDLERVLRWRNDPEVRRWMYTTHEIALEEHRRWFAGARDDPNRHLLVFEQGGEPRGFVHFTRLRGSDVAEWGFYLAPGAPKGTGTALGIAALDEAFGPLGLHKVCGEALRDNERSIRFHRRLGFAGEGVRLDQHVAEDGVRHSVVQFGLLATDWPAARAELA